LFPANNLFMEHWMYLPSIPLFLLAAFYAETYFTTKSRRAMGALAATAAALAFGAVTFQQNFVWKDRITLFSSILSYNPDLHRIRHNLALAYWIRGDTTAAIRENLLVLEKTQIYPQTFYNLARAYAQTGQFKLAEKYYLDGVARAPGFFPFYRGLARLYWRLGRRDEARRAQMRYQEMRPEEGSFDINVAE
jgi:tetratricopeptide (TPR) repeat protein